MYALNFHIVVWKNNKLNNYIMYMYKLLKIFRNNKIIYIYKINKYNEIILHDCDMV